MNVENTSTYTCGAKIVDVTIVIGKLAKVYICEYPASFTAHWPFKLCVTNRVHYNTLLHVYCKAPIHNTLSCELTAACDPSPPPFSLFVCLFFFCCFFVFFCFFFFCFSLFWKKKVVPSLFGAELRHWCMCISGNDCHNAYSNNHQYILVCHVTI